ncbi:MAG: queuosine salvage family protein [Rickettsiales bacterium]|jgi:hypothetical protein|nr:queuosine salvage family protein [Rickettsiales bacterium]
MEEEEKEDIFEVKEGKLKTVGFLTKEDMNYLKTKGFDPEYNRDKVIREPIENLKRGLPALIEDLPITFLDELSEEEDIAGAPAGIVVLYGDRHTTMFIKNEISGTETEIFILDSWSNEVGSRITDAYKNKKNCILRHPVTGQSINNEEERAVILKEAKEKYDEAFENLVEAAKEYGYDKEFLEELVENNQSSRSYSITDEEKEALGRLEAPLKAACGPKLELTKLELLEEKYTTKEGKEKSRHDLGIQKASGVCGFFILKFTEEICRKVLEEKSKNRNLSTLGALKEITDKFKEYGKKNYIMPHYLLKYGESEESLKLAEKLLRENNITDTLDTSVILPFKKKREELLSAELDKLEKEFEKSKTALENSTMKSKEEREEEKKEKEKAARKFFINKISIGNNLKNKTLKELGDRLKYQETLSEHLNAALGKMEANKKIVASISNSNLVIKAFAKVKNTGENISSSNASLPNKVANQEKSSSLT